MESMESRFPRLCKRLTPSPGILAQRLPHVARCARFGHLAAPVLAVQRHCTAQQHTMSLCSSLLCTLSLT